MSDGRYRKPQNAAAAPENQYPEPLTVVAWRMPAIANGPSIYVSRIGAEAVT